MVVLRKYGRYSLIVLLLTLTACAISPTGRRQLMLVSAEEAIDASTEAYLQTLDPLQQSGKVDTNHQVSRRVQYITGKIIAQAIELYPDIRDWHWEIHVIDDPKTINAWCMAGGKMAIYTGLLHKIHPSDDELAQVLAHEISHAIANHTAEKMSIAMASEVGLATVAMVAGGEDGKKTLAEATLATGVAIQLPNSREAEIEADRMGIELAARAGYDPRAAETLWQKMAEVGNSDTPEFLSTHPNPMNRMSTLRHLVPKMMLYYLEDKDRPVYSLTDTGSKH